MSLYHKDIGFPSCFRAPKVRVHPLYSSHAQQEARNDRYGVIRLPKVIDLAECTPIEVEATGRYIEKIVFRMQYDVLRDLCFVMKPSGFVLTIWVNLRSDTHTTLDRSKYDKP